MKKADHVLIRKLRARMEKHGVCQGNEKTLVGFSGGADSTALLHALFSLLGAERVAALHVNHMLRGEESERDERFCRAFCEKHGISFFCERVDIAALCGGSAVEETARNVRYALLEQVANRADCAAVALAHNAKDNLETMLFCLCRGAGLSGMAGIPPARPLGRLTVFRPLIDCTREEILSYLNENGLSHITDSSNADEHYTRNFIRHNVIPALCRINPHAEENAVRTAEAVSLASRHLQTEARLLLAPYPRAQAPHRVLTEMDGALLYTALNELYRDAGGTALTAVQSAAVIDLLFSAKKGHAVDLTGKITARLDGDTLRFSRDEMPQTAPDRAISLSMGKNELGDILVFVGEHPPAELIRRASFSANVRIPRASLETLSMRPRENGEGYRFGGMTRSLKKLLSGRSAREKSRPLLCDREGILWHPAFALADRATPDAELPVYYLEFDNTEEYHV